MRREDRTRVRRALLPWAVALSAMACQTGPEMVSVPGEEGRLKSAATVRAERRAYDGAPPVIPHEDFGIECTDCHGVMGVEVPDLGYAPAMPHEDTRGMSATSRCRQCHVFDLTDELFVASGFAGLRQDLRAGGRLHGNAPPTIPHKTFMRENCAACHAGPAAREEIRTTHPERVRCGQCHVSVTTLTTFASEGATL